ncbi:PD40 domain-containing protein [bacterium]|nr:PD40 domain-containing protein [bacterium]
MKRRLPLLVLTLLVAAASLAPAATHLMRYAHIHGDLIVFTYENDLWLVDADGGDARRLTSHPGNERFARFSPDGRWIAFTAAYDGGNDVYLMDTRGGEPRRLTWHPGPDFVLGWHPDGDRVLFRSIRETPTREFETYLISVDGGLPERLPIDRGGLASLSPDGDKLAYNRISRENRTWKRYRGGMAQDVWVADFATGAIDRLTDWNGTDNFPMWHGDRIYFASDREDGTLNLYAHDLASGAVTRLTDYDDYDVKYPSLGDGRIVYQYGEQLHVLDTATGATRKVDVRVPSDKVRMRPEYVSVAPTTGSFNLSPGGERLLLEARGEILNLPADEGDPVDLTHTSASREKSAAWSPDGEWIAFVSDRTGEEEIWLTDQKGQQTKQLTRGGEGYLMQPVWSPDSEHLVYSDKFMRLNLVEVPGGKSQVIAQGEYDDAWERWGIQDYAWSPCSRWVAYSMMGHNMNESVYLYSLDSGRTTRVTDDWHTDWSPSFSTDGRYLYFLSNRTFEPVMGFQDQTHVFLDMGRAYMVLLDDAAASPFIHEDVLVEVGADEADEAEEEDEEDEDAAAVTEIDLAGLGGRILACEGLAAGNWFRLEAVDGGFVALRKTGLEFLKYQTVNDETTDLLDLVKYALEDAETTPLLSDINNYHLSPDGAKLVYRVASTYGIVDAGAPASLGDGEVDLSGVRLRVVRGEEYLQIFDEAWRIQRDWFYDPGMHGVDWDATGAKYRRFVPDCGNRGDLNYLIGEMIAELSIGHTYIFGGDYADGGPRVGVGLLGAEFTADDGADYYRISRIVPGSSWDEGERAPLTAPGCPVREGQYLISIDGREVRAGDNVYRHLEDKSGRMVTLTVNDRPTASGATTCRVRTIGWEGAIRYREWVEGNRAAVEARGDGRIGYMHLPDMMTGGLIEFGKAFYPQFAREALVIDERYNGGGFVGDMIIDRLERGLWSLNQPREGRMGRNPERCFHGPIVVLINEDTGSNGEYFAYAVKAKGLATVMGMRTWGGAVGIEPHQGMVDGSGTTPPQFAPIGLDGTWIIEGHGVEPDIVVMNAPADVVAGRDAQLEAAVDHLLETLAREGARWRLPGRPDFPDKSK